MAKEEAKDMSLDTVLKALGFSHKKAKHVETTGKHDIFDHKGHFVGAMTAYEVWQWIDDGGPQKLMEEEFSSPAVLRALAQYHVRRAEIALTPDERAVYCLNALSALNEISR